jgi:hypothetical protein
MPSDKRYNPHCYANHSGGGTNMANGERVQKQVSQRTETIIIFTMLLSYALLGIGFFGCLMILAATGIVS